jgi:hypothetical protein
MQLQELVINMPNLLPGTFYFGGRMESAIRSAKVVAGRIVKQVIAQESN